MNVEHLAHDLFLLMLNLAQVKSQPRILTLFLEAINSLELDLQCRLLATDESTSSEVIEIATNQNFFGRLALEGNLTNQPTAHLSLLRNAVQMLALILENRLQQEILANQNLQLETIVQQRTAELTQVNKKLKVEIAERQQVENALIKSEEKYRSVVENANEAIMVVCEGVIVFCNPKLVEYTGYSATELQSMSFLKLIHPDEREMVIDRHQRRLKGEHPPDVYSLRGVDKQGQIKWVEIRVVLIDWEGKPAILNFLSDVTERKETEKALRESQQQYQTIFNGMLDGYALHEIICDADGQPIDYRFLEINPAFERFTGLKREAIVGKTILEILPGTEPYWIETYGRVALTGESVQFENYSHQIGRKWFEVVAFSPAEKQFITIFHDITERKLAEESLRESEERYRALVELSPIPIMVHCEEQFVFLNPAAIETLGGIDLDDFIGQAIWMIIHPDYQTIEQHRITEIYDKIEPVALLEEQFIRLDGDIIDVEVIETVIDYGGQPAAQVVFRDITAQKKAAAERDRLFNLSIDMLCIAGFDGFFKQVNPAWQRTLGWTVEELSSQPWLEFVHPADHQASIESAQQLRTGRPIVAFENRYRAKDGSYRWLSWNSFPLPDENLIFGVVRDITTQKQTAEEILRRNRELILLNRVIAVSVIDQQPAQVLELVCRELALTFEMVQATAIFFNQEHTEATIMAEYLAEGRTSTIQETIAIPQNPAFQYLLSRKAPLIIEDVQHQRHMAPIYQFMLQRHSRAMFLFPLMIRREVIGAFCLEATTPRRLSTEEISLIWRVADQVAGALTRIRLNQERRRLSTALEQVAEGVVITDAEGLIVYVNPTFEQLNGYSHAEVVGQTPRLLKSGKHEAAFYDKLWDTITAGQVWRDRLVNKKKDDSFYTAEVTISPVQDEKGRIVSYVGLQRDVTRELQLELQYQQAQKMQAIGRLAGGVAHDFNNILTAIMSYAGLALATLTPDQPIYQDIEGILGTARRAANLTRQLLTFARRQFIAPKILNLNQLIMEMDKMLRRLINENIELITLPGPDLGQVKADAGQIEQVVVNLVVNARDAMPDGGKLTIQTANVTLDHDYVAQYAELEAGDYVMLTVSDTGAGMTDEVKAHLFEPFFTTKKAGQGTGLGLATCFGIIKQSGGHIWVYSEVGQGTIFKIYLPRITEAIDSQSPTKQRVMLPRGNETILLVEDELSVQQVAVRTLRQQGYRVFGAANGEEALRILQEQSIKHIDLLLSDVVMPHMGGKALKEHLKTIYRDLKVLFTSGYTDQAIISNGLLDEEIAFLQKPFSPADLAHKVRQVLDAPM